MTKRNEPKELDNRSKLLEALRFVAFASTGHDNEEYNYIKIKNGILSATDNVITMGVPIDDQLDICLHGGKFKAALEQCGDNYKFTQIDKVSISIRSEKFRAIVASIDSDLIADNLPDQYCASIDNSIRSGFEIVNNIVDAKAERAFVQGALLQADTICATNGAMAFEYWHGFDLPGGLMIPKRALNAICKIKKPLVGFGFSFHSATFYFDDASFVKTKLVDTTFPDTSKLYAQFDAAKFYALPYDFYNATDAIASFIDNDTLFFLNGYLATNQSLEIGANYQVEGLPGNYAFSNKYWQILREYVKTVSFQNDNKKPIAFRGDNLRGLLCPKNF